MHHTLDHRVSDLCLSAAAAAMARQLAEPDGRVVFEQHPLTNEPVRWSVGAHDLTTGHDGRFVVEPYRQLLAYGLAEIVPCEPPYVVTDDWTGRRLSHPWAIVLTERGRAWVADGCRLGIEPPASGMRRRRAA